MQHKHHNQSSRFGFTLVEVTFVIVIVAIIATLIAVGYPAALKNARSVKMHATAVEYRDALEIYFSKYGKYPKSYRDADSTNQYGSGHYFACLGDGYQKRSGTPASLPACVWSVGHNAYSDSTFNTRLARASPVKANISEYDPVCGKRSDGNIQCSQGIVFQSIEPNVGIPAAAFLDGKPIVNYIYYTLPYDNGCIETLKSSDSINYTRDSNAKEDGNNFKDGISSCMMILANQDPVD